MNNKWLKTALTASIFLTFALFFAMAPFSGVEAGEVSSYNFTTEPLGPVSNLPYWTGSIGEVVERPSGSNVLRVTPSGFYSYNSSQVYYTNPSDDPELFDMSGFDSFKFSFYHDSADSDDTGSSFFWNNNSYSNSRKEVHLKSSGHDPQVSGSSLISITSNNSNVRFSIKDSDGSLLDRITLDNSLILDYTDGELGRYEFRVNRDGDFVEFYMTGPSGPSHFLGSVDVGEDIWANSQYKYITLGGSNRSHSWEVESFSAYFSEPEPTDGYVDIMDFDLSRLFYRVSLDEASGGSDDYVFGTTSLKVYDSDGVLIQEETLPEFQYKTGSVYYPEINLQSQGFHFSEYPSGDYTFQVSVDPYFQQSLTDSHEFTIGDFADLPINVDPVINAFDIGSNHLDFNVDFSQISESYPVEIYLNVDGQNKEVDSFTLSEDISKSYTENISEFLTVGSSDAHITAVVYYDGQPYGFTSDTFEVEHDGSFGGQFPELSDSFSDIESGAMSILRNFRETFLNFFDNIKKQFPFNFFYAGFDAFNTAYEDFQSLPEPDYPELIIEWEFLNESYSVNFFPMEKLMTDQNLYGSGFYAGDIIGILRNLAGASLIVTFMLYLFKMIPARVLKLSNRSSE